MVNLTTSDNHQPTSIDTLYDTTEYDLLKNNLFLLHRFNPYESEEQWVLKEQVAVKEGSLEFEQHEGGLEVVFSILLHRALPCPLSFQVLASFPTDISHDNSQDWWVAWGLFSDHHVIGTATGTFTAFYTDFKDHVQEHAEPFSKMEIRPAQSKLTAYLVITNSDILKHLPQTQHHHDTMVGCYPVNPYGDDLPVRESRADEMKDKLNALSVASYLLSLSPEEFNTAVTNASGDDILEYLCEVANIFLDNIEDGLLIDEAFQQHYTEIKQRGDPLLQKLQFF